MKFFFVVISILCLTFLRPVLFIATPIIVALCFIKFNLRLRTNALALLLLIIICGVISSLIEGFFLINLALSLYMLLPLLLLIMGKPKPSEKLLDKATFKEFFGIFCKVLVAINISAFIYAVIVVWSSAYPEDVFTGLYGSGGFGSHSLSVINLMVSAYFFFKKKYYRFTFFAVCGISGFFGLGLIIYLLVLALVMLPIILKNIIKFFKVFLAVFLFIVIMFSLNLGNYEYLKINKEYAELFFEDYSFEAEIKKMKNNERTFVPRYLTFADGASSLLFSDLKVFFLGTSPGTFNSRTAFYLNGDFIGNKKVRESLDYKTTYHKDYVFPMMNRAYLANTNWNDGTRNQPFSSILSVLLEYGIFVGGLILITIFSRFWKVSKKTSTRSQKNFIRFLMYFSFFLCLLQYYLEVLEIIIPIFIIVKLTEVDFVNSEHERITDQ